MSNPTAKPEAKIDLPPNTPRYDPGLIMVLEGGQEDTTERPSRHSFLDRATERVYSEEELQFMKTMDRLRDEGRLPFPSWTAALEVLHTLGYRKVAESNTHVPFTPRTAVIERETLETKIIMRLVLDGMGRSDVATGVGFFDHMLTLLTKHSLIDLEVKATGDLRVDPHHTVEDVGICFGKALAQALGDKAGIRRYGSVTLPMDETLVTAAVDLGGRPFCSWNVEVPIEMLGTFNAPLAEEFWRAVAINGALNLHVMGHQGRNTHHIVEAIFKAAGRALRQAIEADPRMVGVPSTKGVL